jgi:hypothetical protein
VISFLFKEENLLSSYRRNKGNTGKLKYGRSIGNSVVKAPKTLSWPTSSMPHQQQSKECFVQTHTAAGTSFNRNGNIPITYFVEAGETIEVFRDFTGNHNKTLIQLEGSFVLGATIEVTIEMKGSSEPIVISVPPNVSKALQVENVESITVSNSNPVSNGGIDIYFEKTFCICCQAKNKFGPLMSACIKSLPKGHCSISTHTVSGAGAEGETGNIPFRIDLPAGETQTAFEDFTRNHNKTMLQISTLGAGPAMDITIRTRASELPITETIPGDFNTRLFQVEDFESLIVSNPSTNLGGILVHIQKTFCICC